MQTAGSARGVAAALALLEEMRERGIPRSAQVYATIMGLCVRADQLQNALAMYDAMLAEGLEPPLIAYHTLIDAYGQLRQWQSAVAVLDMVASKVRPRSVVRLSMGSKCSQCGGARWRSTALASPRNRGACTCHICSGVCPAALLECAAPATAQAHADEFELLQLQLQGNGIV